MVNMSESAQYRYRYTGDLPCECAGQLWQPGEDKTVDLPIVNGQFIRLALENPGMDNAPPEQPSQSEVTHAE